MMGRGDWIEALGMDVPETYDELHELLMAMKNQYGCTTAIYLDSAAVGNDNFLAARLRRPLYAGHQCQGKLLDGSGRQGAGRHHQ